MLRRRRRRLVIPFLAPAVILYVVFFIYPAIKAIYVSLFSWSGFTQQMKWVGLANFRELAHDEIFWLSFKNTMYVVFVGGVAIFALAFFFTATIGSDRRFSRVARAIIFFPNVVAPVALASLWGFIYNKNFGLINSFLRAVHLDSLQRTWTSPDHIFWAILVALVWIYCGFYMVILVAGMKKIPQEIYESARLEGANSLQQFFLVTIPLLWDILIISVILWIIAAVKIFEFIYVFGGAWPPQNAWTIPIYMYVMAFGKRQPIYRLGYATAIALTMLIIILVLTLLIRRLTRRDVIEY